MISRRSVLMLGLTGLLAVGAAGVQAKTKIRKPNFASFGLVTNLDLDGGTFTLHRPRGPLSKRDVTITFDANTVFVDTKHRNVTDNILAEGQLVQVAGFKSEGTVAASQIAIVTNPTTTTTTQKGKDKKGGPGPGPDPKPKDTTTTAAPTTVAPTTAPPTTAAPATTEPAAPAPATPAP